MEGEYWDEWLVEILYDGRRFHIIGGGGVPTLSVNEVTPTGVKAPIKKDKIAVLEQYHKMMQEDAY